MASGVVEGGCKSVIGQRLKLSGMFWSNTGADAIIARRCYVRSDRDDEFWRLPAERREPNRGHVRCQQVSETCRVIDPEFAVGWERGSAVIYLVGALRYFFAEVRQDHQIPTRRGTVR